MVLEACSTCISLGQSNFTYWYKARSLGSFSLTVYQQKNCRFLITQGLFSATFTLTAESLRGNLEDAADRKAAP